MNSLAAKLGLSKDLAFYDVYSLSDTELLSLIPRPVYALLVIIPLTPSWNAFRVAEDAEKGDYAGSGASGTSHHQSHHEDKKAYSTQTRANLTI
jgi:ubiquitin carboxyl-terminal hydrolase L3